MNSVSIFGKDDDINIRKNLKYPKIIGINGVNSTKNLSFHVLFS